MTIERLGPVDPVQRFSQTEKTQRGASKPENDSVSFSDEARIKAELLRMADQVKNAPDVRADRVAEVRKKLEDPNYINDVVIEHTAEQIMDMFSL
jgi:negative regulator of flagellin synthesis FlgM